jgi:hypothetical protein
MEMNEVEQRVFKKPEPPEPRTGLSADCTLDKLIVMAIFMECREHPCDRCNMDRDVCQGYPRLNRR